MSELEAEEQPSCHSLSIAITETWSHAFMCMLTMDRLYTLQPSASKWENMSLDSSLEVRGLVFLLFKDFRIECGLIGAAEWAIKRLEEGQMRYKRWPFAKSSIWSRINALIDSPPLTESILPPSQWQELHSWKQQSIHSGVRKRNRRWFLFKLYYNSHLR